jgi:FdhD protein
MNKNPVFSNDSSQIRKGTNRVSALRISTTGAPSVEESCRIIEEDALTVDVEGVGKYTLMWTPTQNVEGAVGFTDQDGVLGEYDNPEALALAAGFAFTEGIIGGLDDVKTMAVCPDEPEVVQMQLVDPESAKVRRRDVLITSSCGICGKRDIIDNNAYGLSSVPDSMQLEAPGFSALMAKMKSGQDIFQDTGGSHAAAIFSADGHVFSVGEDLGRHNALDKVIGRHLLEKRSFAQCGVLLSSRLSLEMAVKTVRAGFEIVAAVSAPTSLAVDVADRFGLTLCGFVRGERATIYTHPHRIITND